MRHVAAGLFALAWVGGWTATADAGAWTLGQWKSYHKLAVSYLDAAREFNNDGEVVAPALGKTYTETAVSYFGELGVLRRADVIVQGAYKRAAAEDDERETEYGGASDLELGAKYQWLDVSPVVSSVQFLYKYPFLYNEDDAKLPPGQGQADYEGRLQFGVSLYPLPLYAGVEGGYRVRAAEPSDEWRYLLEAGASFWRLAPRVKLDGIASAGNADEGDSVDATAGLEYAVGKLDAALGFKVLDAFYLEGGYAHTLYGRNTLYGDTWSAAAVLVF